jgi:hypothetical protein
MLYDVFICHAGEDKDDFVRPLAKRLKKNHIEVWYDEFSLKVGDSIRRAIDKGLTKSRYGIVVLSKNFFNKGWPKWELDGLVQRQNEEKKNIILPVWYNISRDEILTISPSLADKKATLASKGLNHVVTELLKVIKPEGSTLLIARDRVLELGYEPPVVTDDWWLDVAEYSGSSYHLERWGFPLPYGGEKPAERGERLAWAALQMLWQEAAEYNEISQITHPKKVLQFIASQPGLAEICHEYPRHLTQYAPQLTIRGFGGEFEEGFEALYKQSVLKQNEERQKGSISGTALTRDGLPPTCDGIWALRDPTFGNYEPDNIACNFVQGEFMGPTVKVYETIDYIVWFLSNQSYWVPKKILGFLLEGFKDWWIAWGWGPGASGHAQDFVPNQSTGKLFSAMHKAETFGKFRLTKDCMIDIETRFDYAVNLFGLSETAETLAQRFIDSGFIEAWFKNEASRARS